MLCFTTGGMGNKQQFQDWREGVKSFRTGGGVQSHITWHMTYILVADRYLDRLLLSLEFNKNTVEISEKS